MADDVRLIDANKLLKDCIEGDGDDEFTEGYNFAVQEISAYIKHAPTIEAQPVKLGKWDDSYDGITPVCTVCGKTHRCIMRNPGYCPNCGAKMGGESDA